MPRQKQRLSLDETPFSSRTTIFNRLLGSFRSEVKHDGYTVTFPKKVVVVYSCNCSTRTMTFFLTDISRGNVVKRFYCVKCKGMMKMINFMTNSENKKKERSVFEIQDSNSPIYDDFIFRMRKMGPCDYENVKDVDVERARFSVLYTEVAQKMMFSPPREVYAEWKRLQNPPDRYDDEAMYQRFLRAYQSFVRDEQVFHFLKSTLKNVVVERTPELDRKGVDVAITGTREPFVKVAVHVKVDTYRSRMYERMREKHDPNYVHGYAKLSLDNAFDVNGWFLFKLDQLEKIKDEVEKTLKR